MQLLKALQQVSIKPDALDAKLAEFAFVPISHVLRSSRTLPVRALELSLEAISILLNSGWKEELSPALSGQILILFTFLANPSSAENGIPNTSEELQTAAFKCMAELFTNISRYSKGKSALVEIANIPTLGKAILVILDSLTEVKSNVVRLQALMALQALIPSIEDQDALASFFPRMVSSLTKLLTPTSTKSASFRILERGLNTLSSLLLRVLCDRETKALPLQNSDIEMDNSRGFLRTTSWLHATATQIKLALANILKLRNHDKNEVRHALLQLCLNVINECRTSLSGCMSMIMETVVTLAGREGEYDTIEHEIRALLYLDPKLSDLLRDSLYIWVRSLPHLMRSKDGTGRRQIIHQISITLRLLKKEQVVLDQLDDFLAENLCEGLSNILGDSKALGPIVESESLTMEPSLVLGDIQTMAFQSLELCLRGQNDILKEFQYLLKELAISNSALTVAQDLIYGIEVGTQERRLASFWLAVNLLKEIMDHNAPVHDFLVLDAPNSQDELLQVLYTNSLTRLTKLNTDSGQHWYFQALALEVITLQASRYRTDFRAELVEALYPVLHLLGNPNLPLRNHAMACLNILANQCGYFSAGDLVISNVDYIVNAAGIQLYCGQISPQAPQVLLMMMRLCGPSLLPYLDDLVGSMFSALETFHGYPKLVELLFLVLGGMVEEGVKAPQLTIGDIKATNRQSEKPLNMSSVVDAINLMEAETLKHDEEHQKVMEGSFPHQPWKGLDDTTAGNPSSQSNTEEEHAILASEAPPPVSQTFDIILKISSLTQHYLTSSSPSLRASLLMLLQTTIPALAKHEDSFLPLINTLWPVLLPRINDPEAYIVSNTLDVMASICTHAGNFMKSRIEGAWGDLTALHQRIVKQTDNRPMSGKLKSTNLNIGYKGNSVMSSTIDSDINTYRPDLYVGVPVRMISESLAQLLSTVAKHVAIREEYFDDVLDIVDTALEQGDIRKALEVRNADAVWLRLFIKSKQQDSEKGFGHDSPTRFLVSVGNFPEDHQPHWNFIQVK